MSSCYSPLYQWRSKLMFASIYTVFLTTRFGKDMSMSSQSWSKATLHLPEDTTDI